MSNRLTRGLALVGSLASDTGITIGAMGTSASDAATKAYVDATAQGLNVKGSVVAATTANITLSGAQTVDGIALVAGNRALVKNQSTASQNGIYVVASGAWARAADQAVPTIGDYTFVESGTVNGAQGWMATTATAWTQFSAAGEYTGGAGITITGASIAFNGNSPGLTGAVAATRFVGGTASAAPVAGTFAIGDFVIGQTGAIWVCTAPGTPGTWAEAGSILTGVAASAGNDTSAGATVTAPSVSSGVAFTPSATSNAQVTFQFAAATGSYTLTYGPSTGAEHALATGAATLINEAGVVSFMVPKGWKVVLTLTTVTLAATLVTTF